MTTPETLPDTTPYSFQERVLPWLIACFGEKIASDKIERNHRFLEEALELVQSTGCTQSEAHQLVDYVYGRDVGDPPQEVGGVMVTLAALCLAHGMDMHEAGEIELARIWTKVEKIRAKQATKPQHSPLPQHVRADTRPAPVSGWQPIETAPKDGRPVLLWSSASHTYPLFGRYWEQDDEWQEDADHTPCQPTHWMPLPPAPGETTRPAPAVDHEALDDYLGDVSRHTVTVNRGWADVEPDIDGEWCRYEDVKANVLRALSTRPAPVVMPEDDARSLIRDIGNQLHNLACSIHDNEDLQDALGGAASRLWAMAPPTPAVDGQTDADVERMARAIYESHRDQDPQPKSWAKWDEEPSPGYFDWWRDKARAAYEGERKDG